MKTTIFSIVFAVLVGLGVSMVVRNSFNKVVTGLTTSPPPITVAQK